MNALRILLACDKPGVCAEIKSLLENPGYRIETASSEESLLNSLTQAPPGLVLLDMVIGGANGLQVLERCKNIRPQQKVVMISCASNETEIVQAIKLGAEDFVAGPFQASRLQSIASRALGSGSDIADSYAHGKKGNQIVDTLGDDSFFLAASPAMKQIRAQTELIAKVDMPVLLLGESGVGKEIIARLIHKLSLRARAPLLKVNCAALPSELLESELFGYEEGAFTGADKSKPGKFELCHKGTMLLDEIGEMNPWLQAKLLHVLQDGECSRLGGKKNMSLDVRILAATNIDVDMAIAGKRFRQDLLYRLNAFTIKVPPLRERREEIPLLLAAFMKKQALKLQRPPLPISEKLFQACVAYHWPGNLRELANVVKRYLVMEDENLIIEELQSGSRKAAAHRSHKTPAASSRVRSKAPSGWVREQPEVEEIQRVLENVNWNRRVAAAQLNISYESLQSKIKQHGLFPPPRPGNGRLDCR